MRMERDEFASAPAWRVVDVVGAEPEFVAPNVNEEDGENAEDVETEFLDGNRLLPAVRKGITPEGRAERGLPIDEGEESEPEEDIEQNAASGDEQRGPPEGPFLDSIIFALPLPENQR